MRNKPLIIAVFCIVSVICTFCTTVKKSNDSENQTENLSNNTYKVSQETYNITFNEIYQFIEKIQKIMDREDYETWKSILTKEYVLKNSDPFYLKQVSEEPSLKNSNITIKNLKDFFLFVFIPSRTGIKMDRIEFLDQNSVKVIAIVNNTNYVIYLLEKDNNKLWKIGVW